MVAVNDEKAKLKIGSGSPATTINESGLYSLTIFSRKPSVRNYRDVGSFPYGVPVQIEHASRWPNHNMPLRAPQKPSQWGGAFSAPIIPPKDIRRSTAIV